MWRTLSDVASTALHRDAPKLQAIRATTGTALSPFGTYSVELKDTSAPWKPDARRKSG